MTMTQMGPRTRMSRDEEAEVALPSGRVVGTAVCRLRQTPHLRGGPDGLDILLTTIRWQPGHDVPDWWNTPTYRLRFSDGEEVEGFFARWPAEADPREAHRFHPRPAFGNGRPVSHL